MPKEELVLTDYFDVLLRRKWFIILILVLVTGLAYWWSRHELVIYRSKARIKIHRQMTFTQMFDEIMISTTDPVESYTHEVTSFIVASNAAAFLAAPLGPGMDDIFAIRNSINVERIKGTDLLDIFATGTTPVLARRRAEAITMAFMVQHDKAMSQYSQDIYKSVKDSYDKLMSGFQAKHAELMENLGAGIISGEGVDELAPLRTRLSDLRSRQQDLKISGNYTDEYPELIQIKMQIATIEAEMERTLKTTIERRAKLDEYERYKAIMNDIELFFSRRIEEAKIATSKKSESIILIEPASDGVPLSTGKARKTMAGALLGLMLGIVLAFVADNLDTSVRTIGEIEELCRLPVVGIIPHFSLHDISVAPGRRSLFDYVRYSALFSSLRVLGNAITLAFSRKIHGHVVPENQPCELIVPFAPRSPASEAYRTLRTQLQLLQGSEKALLVTSASPAEGKTTTNSNLALAFAQAGKRTLLVNANMRRPQICRIFGLKRERGLSDILLGELPWRETVKDYRDIVLGEGSAGALATTTGIDNLFFITCGGRTVHPAEYLSQPILRELVKEWSADYDVVLIDAPPVLPVPDSLILASVVPNTIIIYQVGVTARESVKRAILSLQNAGSHMLGVVLNDLHSSWANSPEFFHYRTYYGRHE